MGRLTLYRSRTGCWVVREGDKVTDIYPPFHWREAYDTARRRSMLAALSVKDIT